MVIVRWSIIADPGRYRMPEPHSDAKILTVTELVALRPSGW